MPTIELATELHQLTEECRAKSDDRFEVEWNLFTTLCLKRVDQMMKSRDKSSIEELELQLKQALTTESRLQLINNDVQLHELIETMAQNFKHGGPSGHNQKNVTIARNYLKCARQFQSLGEDNHHKALEQTNRVSVLSLNLFKFM